MKCQVFVSRGGRVSRVMQEREDLKENLELM